MCRLFMLLIRTNLYKTTNWWHTMDKYNKYITCIKFIYYCYCS